MGSSTNGKKHKKEKKHRRHRSRSTSDEEDGHLRHHQKHKKHREQREELSDRERERHKKHRHHHHRHHHQEYEYEYEKKRTEIIAVQESDSDSSDCVEVPVTDSPNNQVSKQSPERQPPPPPNWSQSIQQDVREHSSSHRHAREGAASRREDSGSRREDLSARRDERDRERDRERSAALSSRRDAYEEYDSRRAQRDNKDVSSSHRDGRDYGNSRHRERPSTPPPASTSRRTPPPPRISKRRHEQSDEEREAYEDGPSTTKSRRMRTPPPPPPPDVGRFSPIPENGAGDVLSIEETNKLRAKLGLKPLEVDSGPIKSSAASTSKAAASSEPKRNAGEKDLSKYKDEWGEFLHKPAANLKEKAEAEKMRDKLKQRKEKRSIEDRLHRIKTLGESDEEVDDVSKWVQRSKRVVDEKKEAERRAKMLEEMDAEFGVDDLLKQDQIEARRKAYSDKNLKGLRVEHDIEDFSEGRTVILTLKDKDVLNEEDGDTLVNVNMIDNERYRKNVEHKKQNPLSYGYDVYEEQYDHFGNPIERDILAKYNEDLDGNKKKKKDFVIGENVEEAKERKRKLLEIQTKLAGKRLESLADIQLEMATDTFSEAELAKFKKPKKKVRKLRQKLKADDLLPLDNEQHFGSRHGRRRMSDDDVEPMETDEKPNVNDMKIEDEDDDDLERVLTKARKLKQKENLITKPLPIDVTAIKQELKTEPTDAATDYNIILNSTAEFCRTLGDIPTYGMSGNRNVDANDRIDYEEENDEDNALQMQHYNDEVTEAQHGTWNSVNPEDSIRPIDLDVNGTGNGEDVEDIAILDEEPDVGAGVANALRLALSKGYLEKEEHNRPSNSKMAHLQAKNYSIEDKSAADDEKVGRRDRYHAGPIMDFRDKDNFKPNVKLEYIDDNGRILNLKEAFRYLSHKFHGKGPGKNKIEKRLKKMEQDGLMKTMSSTDTPLGTLTMLQQKQKETKTPYVVLSGGKQTPGSTTISKYK